MLIQLQEQGSDQPSTTSTPSTSTCTELLRVREEAGVLRAALNDNALRSIDTHKLRAEIARLWRHHNALPIIISMRNTETLGSSVLGTLAQLSTDLERAGSALVLYKVPKEVSKVLKKTRLDRIINTARDRSAAKKKARALTSKTGFLRRNPAA